MGAGRRQRERVGVEKYQLESERGKHLKCPQIRGVSEWTGTQSPWLWMQACCCKAVGSEVLTAGLSRCSWSVSAQAGQANSLPERPEGENSVSSKARSLELAS